MEDLKARKRVRDDSEVSDSEIDSPEVKRLRENLLDSLDDDAEFCTTSQDLDSFMKSFEEEITASPVNAAAGEALPVVDLTSDSGDSRPDLGYLLEASDDELGLPPTTSSPGGLDTEIRSELSRVESVSSDLGSEFWEMPGCDPFGFGMSEPDYNNGSYGEYADFDGLFDYSDMGSGSGDIAWRPESLPAQ
ncbi:hypothetical protein ACS0TY_008322 [Phlomoides rotata]